MSLIKYTGLILLLFGRFFSASSQDKTPPDRPYITYVTVDTLNNNVNIFWTKSPSSDVKQYNIYYEIITINGYEGVKFDSVSAEKSAYIHSETEAGQKKILYSVTAVDSSGNESLRTPGLHSTIYSSIYYDSCNNSLTVFWNKYIGWDSNVAGYRIYKKEGTNQYLPPKGVNASDSTYTFYNINQNTHNYFYVEAVKNDGLVSRSNIVHKYTFMHEPPSEMVIDYATVRDDSKVDMKFEFSSSPINDFVLLRSSDINSDFIRRRQYNDVTDSPVIITDTIIADNQSFYYRIGAINSCNSIIDTSNLASNILLTGINANKIISLDWTPYQTFPYGLATYEVYRLDQLGNATLIGTTSSTEREFNENLSDLFGEKFAGKISYIVHAVENNTGNFSESNICTIDLLTDILIPTAFTPNADGKNDEFKPIINFIPRDYLFVVYNRYGIVIFKSNDPDKGWDGKINGNKPAPEGVYTYHVQYTSFTGQKKVIKPGTVTLFYP